MQRRMTVWLFTLGTSAAAHAQIIVPGADGSDGAFNPTSNVTINLAMADQAAWNGPNPNPSEGVYDPNKWAIVFRYSSVNIPSGVTVTFANHPKNPPVVWLVSGAVTINGEVAVDDGRSYDALNFGIPGPGGFRSGGNGGALGGLGPGGGATTVPGSYGTGPNTYGNSRCVPLVGGSGGGGGMSTAYFNGGAGAVLIAATGTIGINGRIRANGFGYGSGGAIRLVCNRLEGTGYLEAIGGIFLGRIRIEANEVAFGSIGNPPYSFGLPTLSAQLWPEDVTAAPPSVRVLSLGPAPVPPDPNALFEFPYADVNLTTGIGQQLVIEARNIPTGAGPPAWNVVARVVPRASPPFTVAATFASGDDALSTWHATLDLPDGFCAVQVRAAMPPP